MNCTTLLEAKLPVDGWVGCVARFKVAGLTLLVGNLGDMLNELASVTFTTSSRASAEVHEVPRLKLAIAQSGVHSIVEEGKELVEETTLAFSGEAVVEAPEPAAADSQVVIHVLARRHPA